MLAALRTAVIAIIAAILFAVVGAYAGNAFGYGIAWVSGREPAELKDMLIWCFISGILVFSAGAVWAALHLCKAVRWARLIAAGWFCLVTAGAVGMVTLTYVEASRVGSRQH